MLFRCCFFFQLCKTSQPKKSLEVHSSKNNTIAVDSTSHEDIQNISSQKLSMQLSQNSIENVQSTSVNNSKPNNEINVNSASNTGDKAEVPLGVIGHETSLGPNVQETNQVNQSSHVTGSCDQAQGSDVIMAAAAAGQRLEQMWSFMLKSWYVR